MANSGLVWEHERCPLVCRNSDLNASDFADSDLRTDGDH